MAIYKPNKLDIMILLWLLMGWFVLEQYVHSNQMNKILTPGAYTLKMSFYFKNSWEDYTRRASQSPLPQDLVFDAPLSLQDAMDIGHEKLSPTDDNNTFGRSEYYATATESLEAGAGDCDEYATLWYEVLRQQGWRVGVAVGYIWGEFRGGHAVTIAQSERGEFYVLDVQNTRPIPLNEWLYAEEAVLVYVGDQNGTHRFNRWING
mgnify:CR=1 FL=1